MPPSLDNDQNCSMTTRALCCAREKTYLCKRVTFSQVGGVRRYTVGNETLLHVVLVGQAEMLLWYREAEVPTQWQRTFKV